MGTAIEVKEETIEETTQNESNENKTKPRKRIKCKIKKVSIDEIKAAIDRLEYGATLTKNNLQN